MASYVDGVADDALRSRIEEHLSRCAVCLHHVAELKRLVDADVSSGVAVPAEVLTRAESLIAGQGPAGSRFEIAATIRDGVVKILESTGDLLLPRMPSAVPIRGRTETGLSPRLAKSISGYLVTVELVPCRNTVEPKVSLVDESTSECPDGIKAKLYSPGACETKYTQQGHVTFSPVGEGLFSIEVEDVGRIGLDLRAGSTD
jgi:hypothetical protein